MHKALQKALLVALLASLTSWTYAQEQPLGEPEVTIIQQGEQRIEEYRINGFLYAVKITPSVGKPYFLVRAEGQGEDFYHTGKPEMRIPSWQLFTW